MKKDLNYYMDLLAMDAKIFEKQPDGTWGVFYKKLPKITGRGIGTAAAERDLRSQAIEWINNALENGAEVFKKSGKRTVNPVTPRPCPFCGGTNIRLDIAAEDTFVGCEDCDYDVLVGDVYFDKKTPVENQAKKLWNNLRPLEIALENKIAELEGYSNGK